MARKKESFEDAILKIEEIVTALENDEVSLEKSIALYKEGIALSAACQQRLAEAEGEISLLQKTVEGRFLEKPFEAEEE